jgi:hypothetical protein
LGWDGAKDFVGVFEGEVYDVIEMEARCHNKIAVAMEPLLIVSDGAARD